MDERNVKLNSRKGKKAEAKVRAPKVEQSGNIEARVVERVEAKANVVKVVVRKDKCCCMQKLKFESLVQRDKQGQKLKL